MPLLDQPFIDFVPHIKALECGATMQQQVDYSISPYAQAPSTREVPDMAHIYVGIPTGRMRSERGENGYERVSDVRWEGKELPLRALSEVDEFGPGSIRLGSHLSGPVPSDVRVPSTLPSLIRSSRCEAGAPIGLAPWGTRSPAPWLEESRPTSGHLFSDLGAAAQWTSAPRYS